MPLVANETQVRNTRTGKVGVYAGSQHTIDGKEVARVTYTNTGNNRKSFTVSADIGNLAVLEDGREIPFAEARTDIQRCIRCDQTIMGHDVLCSDCREKDEQTWAEIIDRLEHNNPVSEDKPIIRRLLVGVKAAYAECPGKPDSGYIVSRLAMEGISVRAHQILGVMYFLKRNEKGKRNEKRIHGE